MPRDHLLMRPAALLRSVVATTLAASLLSGCGHTARVHGLKPLHPPLQLGPAPEVETLQPTLRWHQAERGAVLYDVIVYRMNACSFNPNDPMDGRRLPEVARNTARAFGALGRGDDPDRPSVYYRQGLSSPSHRIETPLAPRTVYLWSVRTRTDGEVSEWSTADWRGPSKEDRVGNLRRTPKIGALVVGTVLAAMCTRGYGAIDADWGHWQSTRPLNHHPFVFTTP